MMTDSGLRDGCTGAWLDTTALQTQEYRQSSNWRDMTSHTRHLVHFGAVFFNPSMWPRLLGVNACCGGESVNLNYQPRDLASFWLGDKWQQYPSTNCWGSGVRNRLRNCPSIRRTTRTGYSCTIHRYCALLEAFEATLVTSTCQFDGKSSYFSLRFVHVRNTRQTRRLLWRIGPKLLVSADANLRKTCNCPYFVH